METPTPSECKNNPENQNCNSNYKDNERLIDMDEQQEPLDRVKGQSDQFADILSPHPKRLKRALRVVDCCQYSHHKWTINTKTNSKRLVRVRASHCHVRGCPSCDMQRTRKLQARFYQMLPGIEEAYPKARWIFLTLTIPSPRLEETRQTILAMNKAWKRMTMRKEFKAVLGWIRSTEITVGKQGEAYCHPHFHVVLLVKPSYFKKHYVSAARWTEVWRECMRDDRITNVDIQAVKQKSDTPEGMRSEVAEILKYAVKNETKLAHPDWFLRILDETSGLHFMAAGGVLKDALKVSDDKYVFDRENEIEVGESLAFSWRPNERHYRRFPKGDGQG